MKSFKEWIENTNNWILYHGSDSESFIGQIRTNERDAGWFGAGFYLTSNPEYAKRWGEYIYQMIVPQGKYAQIQVIGNYEKIIYNNAEFANEEAGGKKGWFENEYLWAKKFTDALKREGYEGIRVDFDTNKDVEVIVFDPSKVKVLGKTTD